MADETVDPKDTTTPMPTQWVLETEPGRGIDMSAFELSYAGPSGVGPVVQWVVLWRDGRVMDVDGEDEALIVARSNPTCRVGRRVVSPWLRAESTGE
jgi:hypothetical protein